MKKETPYDETSIKQLFYGMSSAFTLTKRKLCSSTTIDLVKESRYVMLARTILNVLKYALDGGYADSLKQ